LTEKSFNAKSLILKPWTEIKGRLVDYAYKNESHLLYIQTTITFQIRIPKNLIKLSRKAFEKYLECNKVSIMRTEKDFRILSFPVGDPGKGWELK
jgi:hypothetical protein